MAKKLIRSINVREKIPNYRFIVTGAVIGGLAGAAVGMFYKIGLINGTAFGVILGGGLGAVIPKQIINDDTNQEVTMQIREEQLDIAKKLIQTGEVTVHKELLKEDKHLVIPVTREELVIEKKIPDTKSPDTTNRPMETIRIPISEERIEIIKQPVVLNNVSINKRRLKETKRIEATLKKEKVNLEITGIPKIINKD